ncbi:phage portal protein [Mariniluteicoccus flavus]
MSSNVCRLAVVSLAERLRVTGFRHDDASRLWEAWTRNDLDQTSAVAHREALALGKAFVIVWADPRGRARVTVESARQMAALQDPGSRAVVAAVKRWETDSTTEAVLYEPDQITRYRAERVGAMAGFKTVERIPNPLGEVPVTVLRNGDRLLDDGVSEMADLLPLVDGLNKTLADMLVGSEYYARPRRWATGIELQADAAGNVTDPFPEGTKMMISEAPESKFGSLPAADLGSYESAVRVLTSQLMAVSALPEHYLGVMTNQPASADALRAAEASLTSRAEARQAVFGRAWERVARQILAVETGADPGLEQVSVTWADPATRSVAQEADAVVKLFSSGLLPASYALARLGYTADQIDEIRAARRAEALDGIATTLPALIGASDG